MTSPGGQVRSGRRVTRPVARNSLLRHLDGSPVSALPSPLRLLLPPSFAASAEAKAELCAVLSAKLSVERVELSVAADYAALQDAMLRGDAELAWAPPLVAARLELHGLPVLVRSVREGSSAFRAALLGLAEAKLDPLRLGGLRAAWVDRESTGGFLLPRAWLRRAGVDPDFGLGAQRFLGSYRAAAEAVLAGEADLCAVTAPATHDRAGELAIEALGLPETQRRRLAVIALTELAPGDAIVAGHAIPADAVAGVRRALVQVTRTLQGRRAVREVLRADGFEPAGPEGTRRVQELVLESLGLSRPGRPCPACAATLRPIARFCDQCGAQLDGEAPALRSRVAADLSGERRVATVLFADLANFTRISGQLEPDAVRDFANACFGPLSDELERAGGTVVKFIGDCIMATFGVPLAREDDARRAVAAALAMKARLAAVSPAIEARFGAPVAMRVGLNTGEVMVGVVGGGRSASIDVMGAAVNAASRIEGAARPGEILLGPSTWRLVRDHFATEPIGPIALKGVVEPMVLHRVLEARASDAPSHEEGLELRQVELEALLQRFTAVLASGAADVVRLVGEPGAGKHRLLSLLGSRLAAHPTRPLVLRLSGAAEDTRAAPFASLARLVRGPLGLATEPDGAPVRRDALRARLRALLGDTPTAERAAQLLAELTLSADHEHTLPDGAEPANLLPSALSALFQAAAHGAPCALVIEDFEHVDAASRRVVVRLAETTGAPLFVVVAGRTEAVAELPADVPTVELLPLDAGRAEAFAARLLAGVTGLPDGLAATLARRAEGSPGGVRAFVELLRDQGRIVAGTDGAGRWTGPATIPAELPDAIRGVHQARLDALPPEEKELLRRAAVCGRVFWQGALQAAWPEALPERVARLVVVLQQRGLVVSRRPSTLPGEVELGFRAGALREVAYASLPRALRVEAHRRVGRFLAERAGLGDPVELEAASHLQSAGLPDEARRPLAAAARRAVRLFAPLDAAGLFRDALAAGAPSPEERAKLSRALADALVAAGRHEEASLALDEAQAGLGTTEAPAELLAGLQLSRALLRKEQGRSDEALAAIEAGLAALGPSPEGLPALQLLGQQAFLRAARGERAAAREALAAALATADGLPGSDPAVRHAVASAHNTLGTLHLFAGEHAAAEQAFLEAATLADGQPSPRLAVASRVNLGALAFDRGEPARAAEHFRAALALARTAGWAKSVAVCASNLGQAELAAGRPSEANAPLVEACAVARRGGLLDVLADATTSRALLALAEGRLDLAALFADEAIDHADRAGGPRFLALAHLAAAEAHAGQADQPGERERALHHLEAARQGLSAAALKGHDGRLAKLEATLREIQ